MSPSRRQFLETSLGASLSIAGIRSIDLVDPPTAFGPLPSPRQLTWHELEFYGVLHFTVNTFTKQISTPTRSVAAARGGGMKGLILTCKHHDGFCLWPSRYTQHCVKARDFVKEISDACARHAVKFGVYLSPWDRNHKDYGRSEYLVYYNRDDFSPGNADVARSNRGDRPGTHWVPAECDVSIRRPFVRPFPRSGSSASPGKEVDHGVHDAR